MKLTAQFFARPGGRFLREKTVYDDDVPPEADGHAPPLTDDDPVPDLEASLPPGAPIDIGAGHIVLVQAGRMRCLVFADGQTRPLPRQRRRRLPAPARVHRTSTPASVVRTAGGQGQAARGAGSLALAP